MEDDTVREVAEIAAAVGGANHNRRSSDAMKTYQWSITALVGVLTLVMGLLIQDERFMSQITVNTFRLDAIEKTYPEQFEKINAALIANGAKIDELAKELREERRGNK